MLFFGILSTFAGRISLELSASKYCHVSRTLLSILAALNNAVVWIVSIHPPISNSSSPLFDPLEPFKVRKSQLVSQSPSCFTAFSVLLQCLSTCRFFRLLWFSLWSAWTAKSTIRLLVFFLLAEIKRSVRISKSQTIVCVSFFRID